MFLQKKFCLISQSSREAIKTLHVKNFLSPKWESFERNLQTKSFSTVSLRRLQQHAQAVLAFALAANVPFTNNQAERGLYPAKVKQNVRGCFRTGQGARVYARLQGVIAARRKQDKNVFAVLRTPFAHQPVTLLAG
jgi:transposase